MDELKNTAPTDDMACESVKTKKRKKTARILMISLCVLFSIVAVICAFAYGVFVHYYKMLDYEQLFDGEDTWSSVSIDDGDDEWEVPDASKLASDEEKDKYIGQVEDVDKSDGMDSGDIEIEQRRIGGALGAIERDYACDYISERDDVINLLLIGIDSRYNISAGLSDTMMVVSVCPSQKKIVLTSFLRDVYVMIPGVGANRLNAAYSYGGPSLLVETIEKNFGVRIDRYMTANFFTFVDVVERIGGVRVYLNDAELGVINDHIYSTNLIVNKGDKDNKTKNKLRLNGSGYYELNGIQALSYARIRNIDSDFGRTNRQRTVIEAIFDRVSDMSPAEWNRLLELILPKIKTNLTQGDIIKIMLSVSAYMKYSIGTASMPPSDSFRYMQIDGRSVIGVDQDYIRAYLSELIYPK